MLLPEWLARNDPRMPAGRDVPLDSANACEVTMPYTPAQQRMLHADAEGRGTKGPSAAVAKKMLAEHAPTRTDVDRAGHAKKKRKKKASP